MQSHEWRRAMTEGAIPDGWERWVRSRVRELRAQGLSRSLAKEFAAKEATGRARLARTVGMQIARAARLDWENLPNGDTRWFLRVKEPLPAGVRLFAMLGSAR